MRVFRCKRCKKIVEASYNLVTADTEHRCYDDKAPGGYWYCNYEELVPKKAKKKI